MPSAPPTDVEAKPPRAVALPASVRQARAAADTYRRGREAVELRSVLRGSILLGLGALVFSLLRAGVDRAFYPGWWRQW